MSDPFTRVLDRFATAHGLTVAEKRVLDYACTMTWASEEELAGTLGIGVGSVRTHRSRILAKAGGDYWRLSHLVIELLRRSLREARAELETKATPIPLAPDSDGEVCPVGTALDEAGVEKVR